MSKSIQMKTKDNEKVENHESIDITDDFSKKTNKKKVRPIFVEETEEHKKKKQEEVDNKDFLTGLFDVMYDELPTPKPKKKK